MQRMMLPLTCRHALAAGNGRIADADGRCAAWSEQDLLTPTHAKEFCDRLMSLIESVWPLGGSDRHRISNDFRNDLRFRPARSSVVRIQFAHSLPPAGVEDVIGVSSIGIVRSTHHP